MPHSAKYGALAEPEKNNKDARASKSTLAGRFSGWMKNDALVPARWSGVAAAEEVSDGSEDWLSPEMLEELMTEKSAAKLQEAGGIRAIARGVGSSPNRGLTGDDTELRKRKYGTNTLERAPSPTFFELFMGAMEDTTVIILLVAAAVSIIMSIITCSADLSPSCPRRSWGGRELWSAMGGSPPGHSSQEDGLPGTSNIGPHDERTDTDCSGWMDGVCIIMACVLVGLITAWNETSKETHFRHLQKQQDVDITVTVKRNDEIVRCPAEDIMVGDLVLLETGARVPADGIYLKGNDLRVDESTMTGESHDVYKAVGSRSEWGKLMVDMETERDETPLQEKLGVLAEDIGKAGTLVAALCFMAQLINWLYSLGQETCFMPAEGNLKEPVEDCVLGYSGLHDKAACEAKGYLWQTGFTYWNWMHLKHVVLFFIDSVTIIVVAVPEGLPLAVTISLAYSVKKMQADKNLVRVMAACETMGSCTNICSDKTGTLTENVMTVVDGYIAGKTYSNLILPGSPGVGRPGSPGFEQNKFKLKAAAQKIVTEAIACNTRAEIGFDSRTGKHGEIIGNKTEGALLYFLLLLGVDYRELRENTTVIKAYPFSSLKKRMSTIVQIVQHDVIKRRMYTKGASEVILQMCTSYMDEDGSIKAITPKIRTQFSEQIEGMASQGLRTITLAMKDLRDEDDIPSLTTSSQGSPREARPKEGGEAEQDEGTLTLSSLEENMTMIATFGMKDPLRKGVPEAVRKCQRAGITVRMLTGDSLLTAKEIAMDCGILTRDGTAMEGPDFRKLSEAAQKELLSVRTLPNGHVQTLQVLARCSPQDKVQIVRRLKELGEVVAVTGDGTNDAPALKEADVGLSMGIAGTAVAQEASDIVIMDDNFASIVRSVMWGRSVYDNIRRFLQFQLTVNVVALTICLIGSVTGFGTPLKPVQLLWVNLIMDTFGALALATEDPTPELLTRKPYGRNDKLINGHMWRNIAVQATFQLTVQLSLLWFGVFFITDCTEVEGTESGCVDLSANGQGKNLSGNYRDTVIYNTFVWMQLFNEINCRRIFNEVNMMTGICNNPIFVGIWIFSVVVQVTSVEFFGSVFHTVPLDFWDWIACISIASFSLVLGIFQRFLPICPEGSPDNADEIELQQPEDEKS